MTSWNGPDRAGFELDLCVALLLAAETTALALVCLRLISVFSPDMVLQGNFMLAIENRSCSYKLKHQH
tara:strand:- start:610 stop:813 length:204 start_codon:yes stop_codon:yes gene_type:complete